MHKAHNFFFLIDDRFPNLNFKIHIFFFFFNVGPPKRASFWPPSMVYISVINTHILHITNHAGLDPINKKLQKILGTSGQILYNSLLDS